MQDWCSENKLIYANKEELIKIPEVQTQFQNEINDKNKTLGQTEHVKRFRLVADTWTPATGELSPTLKLRRNELHNKYDTVLKEIYYSQKNL